STEIELRLQKSQARIEKLQAQSSAALFDQQQRQNLTVIQQELSSAEAELQSAQTEASRYAPIAPFSGNLYDVNPELHVGSWISNKERIALLVKPDQWIVEAYLDEDAMRRVKLGDKAIFFSEIDSAHNVRLRVSRIEKDASRVLSSGLLSSQAGGSVLVRDSHGQLIPEFAVYKISLEPDQVPSSLSEHSWRGKVLIHGEWEAPGSRFIRSSLALLSREAGF
ncbi:HlyD family efflux transporter periplasmic adaptor subunit, partial [Undibacterium sp.]|uniref:HlyD family efflux transporter periplasmic adaptor subunit n=1 Tax=Undibacterium sp. TaxID=1914977 RepID=UPI0037514D9C